MSSTLGFNFCQTDGSCSPQTLLAGELPLLTLPFRSQVTFRKRIWRQIGLVSVECTVTFLSVCVCKLVGVQICISTEEQWQKRRVPSFLNLYSSPARPFYTHTPFLDQTNLSGLSWAEMSSTWRGRVAPLWDTLTVSSLIKTLPSACWHPSCLEQMQGVWWAHFHLTQ